MTERLKKICSSKWLEVIIFCIYFMIPFIVYRNYYINNSLIVSGDGAGFFAMRMFNKNIWSSAEIPLWNPYLENGVPWAADFNGVFYPIQLLFNLFGLKNYVYIYYAFHIAIGGLFTYKFLQEIDIQKKVAFCTGIIYMLSTHIGGARKSHMILIVAIVYLPIALFFIEKFIKEMRKKHLICAACVMALAFYSGGHVQILFYMDLVLGIYLLLMLVKKKTHFSQIVRLIFLWVLTYVGLIALQIIPAMEMLFYYGANGAAETTYEIFKTYSIHPVKLLMMIFPEIFSGELYLPLGINNSSEMDIEIYVGVSILLIILLNIKKLIKEYHVKVFVGIGIATFLFAAQGHIPVLSKIIYSIPMLNSFRVTSRILYIFIFFLFCIFAKAVNQVVDEIQNLNTSEIRRKQQICGKITAFVLLIFIIIIIAEVMLHYGGTTEILSLVDYTWDLFINNFVVGAVLTGVFYIVLKVYGAKIINRKITASCVLILFTMLPIIETQEYALVTNEISVEELKTRDNTLEALKNDIGTGKILLANPSVDGNYKSIISFSENLSVGVPTINAYISLNNPNLLKLLSYNTGRSAEYNFSGLYTGFEDIYNNLQLDNDILSMLGVTYVIDQEEYIPANGAMVKEFTESKLIYDYSNREVIPNCDGRIYVVQSEALPVKEYTYYRISVNITTKQAQELVVDLYSGDLYDKIAQEHHLVLEEGTHDYQILLNSGMIENVEDIVCRLIFTPSEEIAVNKFTISEEMQSVEEGVYTCMDEDNRIFKNNNAKEILYAAEEVVDIENIEEVYRNRRQYNFDEISYICDIEDFICGETDVSNIIVNNNSVSAIVRCSTKTFINFSQNYYPGWTAYIDGKKTENYFVNGLIQGTVVEAGEHVVEFKFRPMTVYVGGAVTLLTLLLIGAGGIYKKRKNCLK